MHLRAYAALAAVARLTLPKTHGFRLGKVSLDLGIGKGVTVDVCAWSPSPSKLKRAIAHSLVFWALPSSALERYAFHFRTGGSFDCGGVKANGCAHAMQKIEVSLSPAGAGIESGWEGVLIHEIAHVYLFHWKFAMDMDREHKLKQIWDRVASWRP